MRADGSDGHLQSMPLAQWYAWEPAGPRTPGERRAVQQSTIYRQGWLWTDADLDDLLVRFHMTADPDGLAACYGISVGWLYQVLDRAIAMRTARSRRRQVLTLAGVVA